MPHANVLISPSPRVIVSNSVLADIVENEEDTDSETDNAVIDEFIEEANEAKRSVLVANSHASMFLSIGGMSPPQGNQLPVVARTSDVENQGTALVPERGLQIRWPENYTPTMIGVPVRVYGFALMMEETLRSNETRRALQILPTVAAGDRVLDRVSGSSGDYVQGLQGRVLNPDMVRVSTEGNPRRTVCFSGASDGLMHGTVARIPATAADVTQSDLGQWPNLNFAAAVAEVIPRIAETRPDVSQCNGVNNGSTDVTTISDSTKEASGTLALSHVGGSNTSALAPVHSQQIMNGSCSDPMMIEAVLPSVVVAAIGNTRRDELVQNHGKRNRNNGRQRGRWT
ncbi:hypothetical protein NE237_026340 [Protea cynaroides]|uniref:Uncharacterized protein n=1 Tax=Protea cynaroides TaxID=273540 RepID=A0A9Q0H8R4_9MAGN|nr:hypothetical protein NE237_026340 [Protea cynaroides]